jgi:hypothetical protein
LAASPGAPPNSVAMLVLGEGVMLTRFSAVFLHKDQQISVRPKLPGFLSNARR